MRLRRPLRACTASITCLVIGSALGLSGCASTQRKTVWDKEKVRVQVVSQRGVARGFQHPITIAPVRLAHILSRIDIRLSVKEGQQRVPAIPLQVLYAIADGAAHGLSEAKRDQQVAVYAIDNSKHFKIFDENFLTSFILYAKDDLLYIHLSRSQWKVPPRREDNLPDPEVGEHPMSFRVLPSKAMTLVDEQSVAVEWRDPLFVKPTRTHTTADGKVVRRIILMESDDEEPSEQAEEDAGALAPLAPQSLPADLSPKALRDLADLEEEREAGTLTELDYRARRQAIFDREAARNAPATGADSE
jgi:hypothetical protein